MKKRVLSAFLFAGLPVIFFGALPSPLFAADSLHTPRAQLLAYGETVFQGYCTGCHGSDARGYPGAVPPLANSDFFMAIRLRPVSIVLHGLSDSIFVNGVSYLGDMPSWAEALSDYEIASILTYLRVAKNDSTTVSCITVDWENPSTYDEDGHPICQRVARSPQEIAMDSIAVWEVANIRSPPPAPVNLAYALSTAVYIKDVPISPNVPTVTGFVGGYSVSPGLPAGLSLHPATGVLTGTPTVISSAAQFIVRAQNDSGSAYDTLSIRVIGLPGAPVNAVAVVQNNVTEAMVNWTAPASDGGSAITGYTVTATPGGNTCAWASGPLSCKVTGLSYNTMYTHTVTATNAAGTGPASPPTNSVIPVSISGALAFRVSGTGRRYSFAIPDLGPGAEIVTLAISDTRGRTVWSKTTYPDGRVRTMEWDGKTSTGEAVSAGMHLARLIVRNGGDGMEHIRKTVVLKH